MSEVNDIWQIISTNDCCSLISAYKMDEGKEVSPKAILYYVVGVVFRSDAK